MILTFNTGDASLQTNLILIPFLIMTTRPLILTLQESPSTLVDLLHQLPCMTTLYHISSKMERNSGGSSTGKHLITMALKSSFDLVHHQPVMQESVSTSATNGGTIDLQLIESRTQLTLLRHKILPIPNSKQKSSVESVSWLWVMNVHLPHKQKRYATDWTSYFSHAQSITHHQQQRNGNQNHHHNKNVELLMVGDFNRAFEKDWGGVVSGADSEAGRLKLFCRVWKGWFPLHLTTTSLTSDAAHGVKGRAKDQKVTIDYGIMYRPCAMKQATTGSPVVGTIILHDMLNMEVMLGSGTGKPVKSMHKAVWMWLPLLYYESVDVVHSYFKSYSALKSSSARSMLKQLMESVNLKSRKKVDVSSFAEQLNASLQTLLMVPKPKLQK